MNRYELNVTFLRGVYEGGVYEGFNTEIMAVPQKSLFDSLCLSSYL